MAQQHRRNGERTRNNILEGATRLFAYRGLDGVAMRDICKEVGVTLPTIYHHFGNKLQLYRSVEDELYGGSAQALREAMQSSSSPRENLRAFVNSLYQQLQEDEIFHRIVVRNLVEPNTENQEFLVSNALQPLYDVLKDVMNAAKPGSGDSVGPVVLWAAILGFVTLDPAVQHLKGYPYAKRGKKKAREEFVDKLISLCE